MQKIFILLSFLSIAKISFGQKVETVYLDKKDSSSNLYVIIYPPKLPWKGYMFLIPGMFQKAQDVLKQTDLPKLAAQAGILTIIPTFKTGLSSFGIDSTTQASLIDMLKIIRSQHKLLDMNFYMGGFSIGGSCALKYAEQAIRNNPSKGPAAVFVIDAPLDFERMYRTMIRESRLTGAGKNLAAENDYMLNRFKEEFNGTPNESLSSYYKLSPYSFNDTSQYAIKPLIKLPIRLYTEPDVKWWLKEGVDYSGMNCFDLAALANELKSMGNTKVELITTANKGYRKPANEKHPHSWSIAEPADLLKWLLRQ